MNVSWLICLGLVSGAGAGLLAGLIGIGGGIVRGLAGVGIGLVSGFAGVGGGILTNVVMVVSGVPMHKSIGRAAAVGVVVSLPATIIAAFGSAPAKVGNLGSINLSMWACIA